MSDLVPYSNSTRVQGRKGEIPARTVLDFLCRDLPAKVRINGIDHYGDNLDTIVGVHPGSLVIQLVEHMVLELFVCITGVVSRKSLATVGYYD